jgi:16S rRNA (adenine1518-N6/adenine1519-N6)-dimethyltransferase
MAGKRHTGPPRSAGRHKQTAISRKSHFRPRKSLGQHFLRDPNIVRKIIAAVDPQPGDRILEIGPGEGALTVQLAMRAGTLLAVEIDPRAVQNLTRMLAGRNVRILHEDILGVDLQALASESGSRIPLRVVGNIPYNITTPILFHLLDHRAGIRDATLMMQREVAHRLVSPPGCKEYGIPSVLGRLLADIEILFDVSPNAFFPKPGVVSTVVRLVPLQGTRFPVHDLEFFRRMVRFVFGQRRKTLRKSLRSFQKDLPCPPPEDMDLQQRPEELDLESFVHLSNALTCARDRERSAGEKLNTL